MARTFLLMWFAFLMPGMACAQEGAPPAPPQLLQAQALIEEGRSAEAYGLLEPLESQLAGNIQYDYLLGSAR